MPFPHFFLVILGAWALFALIAIVQVLRGRAQVTWYRRGGFRRTGG